MVVFGFFIDLTSQYIGEKPVASGIVVSSDIHPNQSGDYTVMLKIITGSLHKGEYIIADSIGLIISDVESKETTHSSYTKIILKGVLNNNSKFNVYSNQWLINIYILIEAYLIFYLFFILLNTSRVWKLAIIAGSLILTTNWVYFNFIQNGFYMLDDFNNGLATLFVIIYSIVFFFSQLKNTNNLFIYATPSFWIVSAILIYKAGTLFLFLYFNTLQQPEQANYYFINTIFNILKNILLAIGFILQPKTIYSRQSRLTSEL